MNSSHIYFQQRVQRLESLLSPELGVDSLAPGRPALSDCCLPRWSVTASHCYQEQHVCSERVRHLDSEAMTEVVGGRRVLSICSRVPVGHPDGPLHQLPDMLPARGRLTLAVTGCIIWPQFLPLPILTPFVVCSQLGEWYPSLDSQLVM